MMLFLFSGYIKQIVTVVSGQVVREENQHQPKLLAPRIKTPIISHLNKDKIEKKTAITPTTLMTSLGVDECDGIINVGKHKLITINRPRVKGFCVECIKKNQDPDYKSNMKRICTYCPECPGGNWICEPCFVDFHANLISD